MTDLQITRLNGDAVADYRDINKAFDEIEQHDHGAITKDGKVGAAAGMLLMTGAEGAVEAGSADALFTGMGTGEARVALDYYVTTSQAQMRDLEARLALAEAKLAALAP